MKKSLIILFLFIACKSYGQVQFFMLQKDTTRSFYRSITIDHTKVPNTNQTNFPILISGTYTYLKTVANGGKVTDAQGDDIQFFSDAGLTTKLKWDVERYVATTGEFICHVKIPSLLTATDVVIYMQYGNSAITTYQGDRVNSVDGNTVAKYNFQDGTTLSALDVTSNANNGTITGATAGVGQIDGAGVFSGTSQYINVGNGSSLQGLTGSITMEAWVKPTDFANFNGIFAKTTSGGFPRPFDSYISQTTGKLNIFQGGAANANDQWKSTSAISSGVWTHIAMTITGSGTVGRAATFYINGVSDVAVLITSQLFTPSDNGDNTYIATRTDLVTMFKGSIDDLVISNVVRSADWVKTKYNNSSSPSTFYTISAEL